MNNSRTVRILVGLVIALVVCAIVAWIYMGKRDYGVKALPFSAELWKKSAAEQSRQSIRLRMADDLMENTELEGMTRDQIVELLGEPDKTPQVTGVDITYYLGRENSPVGADDEWLAIRLDEKSVVTQAGLKTKPVGRPEAKDVVSPEELKALEEDAKKEAENPPEGASPPGDGNEPNGN